jgi:hypothetical protein
MTQVLVGCCLRVQRFTLAKLSIGRSRTTNELVSDYRGSPTADAADWWPPAKESGSK